MPPKKPGVGVILVLAAGIWGILALIQHQAVTPPRLNPEAIAKAREAVRQRVAMLEGEQQTEQTTTGVPQ